MDVRRAGTYKFEVRRWPQEVTHVSMTEPLPPYNDKGLAHAGGNYSNVQGVAMDIDQVELKLSNGQHLKKKVNKTDRGVIFEVDIKKGPLDIEAWYLNKKGERITGAYYLYVKP